MNQPDEPLATAGEAVIEMSTNECLERLRGTQVGRLAIAGDGHPEIFPINHVVDHGTLIFRTAPGTKLESLTRDRNVTFESDGVDSETGDAWSVIVKGHAVEVTSVRERFEALDLPLYSWNAAPMHHFVRIVPVEITGRRFGIKRRPFDGGSPARRAASE